MSLNPMKTVLAAVLAVGMFATSNGVLLDDVLADKSKRRTAVDKTTDKTNDRKSDKNRATAGPVKNRILSGVFQAVDAAKRTVTVTFRKNDARRDRTFPLANDTKVLLDGRPAKPTELKQGTPVQLRFTPDGKTLLAIRNTPPVVRATIVKRDAKAGTIVVAIASDGKTAEKTYVLDKGARIMIAGKKKAALSDVNPGDVAFLMLSADTSRVAGIRIGPPKNANADDKRKNDKGKKRDK